VASQAPVLLDCRWLSIGGPGRTTELLLRGMAEAPPAEPWVLWGRPETARLSWPAATVVPVAEDPRSLLGQRHALRVPAARLAVFMHQQRPLRRVPALTMIYDTIALRYGATPAVRRVRHVFLRRIAATSRHILTVSEHAKASIVADLGVAPEKVDVLRLPFDGAFVDRVLALRRASPRERVALYVGGFLPHKNLPRLLAAFGSTRFCREGGRLVLAGDTPAQARDLGRRLTPRQRRWATLVPTCGQADLEALFATALLLVQPSLEEGFGLPAWEALCCGLAVCASDGGALPEVVGAFADPFPATSTPAMAAAIDRCARRACEEPRHADAASALLRREAPTVGQFARQFRAIVDRHAG
jgi:glycosyltransferase involved in cell wall biosynthesis